MHLRTYLLSEVGAPAPQPIRFLGLACLLIAATVVAVHMLLPVEQPAGDVLAHAALVTASYGSSLVLFGGVAIWLRRRAARRGRPAEQRIVVWHLWVLSLACFVFGYFGLPLSDASATTLHVDLARGDEPFHFLRLFPVWVLITYLMLESRLVRGTAPGPWAAPRMPEARSVEGAASSLRALPRTEPRVMLRLVSGRKTVELPASDVLRITVDDHYCWVHYLDGDERRKTDLALTMRDIVRSLPDAFVQVHRSHVVNVDRVRACRRRGREHFIRLDGDDLDVPISRRRLVLVRAKLESLSRAPASRAPPARKP